jgi:hypothetical protein
MNNSNENPNTGTNPIDANNDPIARLSASRIAVTAEQMQRMKQISNEIRESSSSQGRFLKFLSGDSKTILFDPDKFERIVMTFPNKEGEPPNKPAKRIKFMVKEMRQEGSLPEEDVEELEWNTSETTGGDILKWLMMGFRLLDIRRTGSGKFDTKFDITPHM